MVVKALGFLEGFYVLGCAPILTLEMWCDQATLGFMRRGLYPTPRTAYPPGFLYISLSASAIDLQKINWKSITGFHCWRATQIPKANLKIYSNFSATSGG